MKRRDTIRSYVLDMPQEEKMNTNTSGYGFKNQKILLRLFSKMHGNNIASPHTEFTTTQSSEGLEKHDIEFTMRYLPYIYAQNGISYIQNILKTQKKYQNVVSLPILRKKSSVNLVNKNNQKKSVKNFHMKSFDLI